MSETKRSKAAASKVADVSQVGLRRGGDPVVQQNRRQSKSHRAEALGSRVVEAQGLRRGGKKEYASYGKTSEGYDIGRNRIHEKPTSAGFFNSKHPGTIPGNTKRAEREAFARNTKWNGPAGQE